MNKTHNLKVAAIDLFCGAGGLSRGLINNSIVVKAGFDIDPACKFAFEENNNAPFILKDVALVEKEEIAKYFQNIDIKIIAGCAPCQPFSRYTQGRDNSNDKKWGMLYEFSRIVKEIQPDIVTMENVPQLLKHDVYKDFEHNLKEMGYFVSSKIVFCPDYGIPQTRQRLVLLASKLGEIQLCPATKTKDNYLTVKDAIGHLPKIKSGETHSKDKLHMTSKMKEITLKRIAASKQGGTWKDWPEDLVAECHKKTSGKSFGSVYGRMSWNKPSPTITTQFVGFGNGRFGHPTQDRALSLREGAILQTFPEDYKFSDPDEPFSIGNIARMIGNAVPVRLGEIIADSITQHINETKQPYAE